MNQKLYNYYIIDRTHRSLRRRWEEDLASEYAKAGLSAEERMVDRFRRACEMEEPKILPFEQIALVRTVANLPDCFTEEEWKAIRSEHYVHELGYVSNLSPNYERTIRKGLLARREEATEAQKKSIDALIGLCDRYRAEADDTVIYIK